MGIARRSPGSTHPTNNALVGWVDPGLAAALPGETHHARSVEQAASIICTSPANRPLASASVQLRRMCSACGAPTDWCGEAQEFLPHSCTVERARRVAGDMGHQPLVSR